MTKSDNANDGDARMSPALRQMLEIFSSLMHDSYLVDNQMPPGKLLAPVLNTRPIDDLPEVERQFRKKVLNDIVREAREKGQAERERLQTETKPPRSRGQ